MIDYKKIREDIQIQINSEEVKNKITSDLNIKLNIKIGQHHVMLSYFYIVMVFYF